MMKEPSIRKPLPFLVQITLWAFIIFLSSQLSLFLPTNQHDAGAKTFIPASYRYVSHLSSFDNTILTWGTDYAIALLMSYFAFRSLAATKSSQGQSHILSSAPLRYRSAALLLSYAISVTVGGYAHQTYFTAEDLNTSSFRFLWTICVGCVTAAGGFMGSCGSAIYRQLHRETPSNKELRVRFHMPIIPDSFWVLYGGYHTYICIVGGMSFQRPACDIFVAGITQFIPTVYNALVLLSIKWNDPIAYTEAQSQIGIDLASDAVLKKYRIMFYVGFFLNAPLLPGYPLLVQFTSLSLGVVNALLHLNLTISWSLQACSLIHFCQALNNIDKQRSGQMQKKET